VGKLKRTIDVLVGTLLALVSIPVILVLAVVVAVALRGWPFFVQERIGRHGRPIRMVKLRTLPPNMPKYALKRDLPDMHVPAVLKFLRRRHIDELPQLLLVPLGRLSLVGPRPKMPDHVEPVDPAYNWARTRVPQGCTCLWQISDRTDVLPSEASEYDWFYLERWSLRLDLWILWRTVVQLAGLAGPVTLDMIPAWASPAPLALDDELLEAPVAAVASAADAELDLNQALA
jgi:lipopolysaccharide/colanic/teichoic acid biosynthesis glycosyltransferase